MPVALAALPEIVMALVAFIILWALSALFGPLLRGMSNRIPLIGATLGRAVEAIVKDAIADGTTWALSVLQYAEGLILAPVFWFEHLIADILNVLDDTGNVLHYITTVALPSYLVAAEAYAAELVGRAEATLTATIDSVVKLFNAEITQVYTTINAVDKALTSYALTLYDDAISYTKAEVTAAIDYTESTAKAIEGEIVTAITTETAYVETEVKAAIAYTTTIAADLTADIDHEVTAITTWVGAELGAVYGAIAAAESAAIAYAGAAVAVVEADLTDLEDNCTDNLCSGLSDLASLFNDLQGDLGLAALFGLAAMAATDPAGFARDVESTLAPITNDAASAVRSLIGL